ncbi:TIR domain-containing protein, partial [Actinoplanes sp. NPDC051633]|uniref:TIR domain-containing protein n=1 Tax=Actinoplanes sp. NPDC051633 TaxID=3155670 RepID=UPI0034392311
MSFDGFISYSHAADGRLAPSVQRGLHRLAKPWHRRRALWIFRDQTGLSVTPHLWTSIQKALDNSEYFVLMASPEAARSPWVNREIEHWVATKPADRILPVVTDGEWQWDPAAKDFSTASTAVPRALRGVFAEEPLYLDLRWARDEQHLSLRHSRFRDAIAQLAAPMHGVSKDDLEGEDVRQHRRAGRLRLAAVAALMVLTVLASLTGMAAVRNAAEANASAVEARRQQQEASVQRGSAAKYANQARQQEDSARKEERRAKAAALEAERQERAARTQKNLADQASAEVKRQLAKADLARAQARLQQALAKRQSELARESAKEMHRQQLRAAEQTRIAREQQRLAAEAGADAREQKRIAKEQERLALEAGALARQAEKVAKEQEQRAKEAAQEAAEQSAEASRQQAKAEQQKRIAVSRRLVNEAKSAMDDDPQGALKLGIAAQKILPDAESRREVANLITSSRHAGTIGDVRMVAYGPDQRLVTVNRDNTVSLWDGTDRTHPVRLSTFGDATPPYEDFDFLLDNAVELSPDGQTLAAIGRSKLILWDVADPRSPAQIAALPAVDRTYSSVAFSPDGRTLVTGDIASHLGFATLWDVSDRAEPTQLARLEQGRKPAASDFAFSADSQTLVVADEGTTIWDIADRAKPVKRSEIASPGGTYAIAFNPAEPALAIGDSEALTIYDLTDPASPQRRTTVVKNAGTPSLSLAYSGNGRILVSAGWDDGKARLWEVDGFQSREIGRVSGRHAMNSLSLSRDGRTLATADSSTTGVLWNVAEYAAPRDRATALTGHMFAMRAMRYGPDGRWVTTVDDQGTATFWEVRDRIKMVQRATAVVYPPGRGGVDFAAISPDGRTIVAGGYTSGMHVTDVSDPAAPVTVASMTPEALNVLAFSPDGRTLVVGDGNKRNLWDLTVPTSPKPLGTLTAARAEGGTVAFSP